MKKLIALILAAVFLPMQAYAKINKSPSSLKDSFSDRLLLLQEDIKILPDFSEYSQLEKIEVSSVNPYYRSADGVLYSKDGKTLIAYPREKSDETFKIPYGTEYIYSGAFSDNRFIKKIELPLSLSKIGANPFSGCRQLRKIRVPNENNYFTFDDGALYNKEKTVMYFCIHGISDFVVPESVTKIAYGAFSRCDTMKNVTLPKKLTTIESMAFSDCFSLSEIFLPERVENINPSCFIGCSALRSISVKNSSFLKSVDGVLYSHDMIDLILCPPGKDGIVTVPGGVVNVLNGAFDGCAKLESVVFPDSLKYVARSFSNCASLKNIELPDNQTIIEYGTFAGCSSLEWIYLPNNVVIIQDGALPENVTIVCDEGSFAEYYAEENAVPFEYKFNIYSGGQRLHLGTLPFELRGKLYIPIADTAEALGGMSYNGLSALGISLNGCTVNFKTNTAEKKRNHQTDIISVDTIEKDGTLYLRADDWGKVFSMDISRNGFSIDICRKDD